VCNPLCRSPPCLSASRRALAQKVHLPCKRGVHGNAHMRNPMLVSSFGLMAAHPPWSLRAISAEAVHALTQPGLTCISGRRVLHAGPGPICVAPLPVHALCMTWKAWAGVFGDWEMSQHVSGALDGLDRTLSAALLDFGAERPPLLQLRAGSPQLLYGAQRLKRRAWSPPERSVCCLMHSWQATIWTGVGGSTQLHRKLARPCTR